MQNDFVTEDEQVVLAMCRIHPHILAVVDIHNLRRGEHFIACAGCFRIWLGKASFDLGIYNALEDAYTTIKPFASEIAAERAEHDRDKESNDESVDPGGTGHEEA
ncbi:MAG: hypothetical protein ACRDH7_07585 [Actinomycetota bacterium]